MIVIIRYVSIEYTYSKNKHMNVSESNEVMTEYFKENVFMKKFTFFG